MTPTPYQLGWDACRCHDKRWWRPCGTPAITFLLILMFFLCSEVQSSPVQSKWLSNREKALPCAASIWCDPPVVRFVSGVEWNSFYLPHLCPQLSPCQIYNSFEFATFGNWNSVSLFRLYLKCQFRFIRFVLKYWWVGELLVRRKQLTTSV